MDEATATIITSSDRTKAERQAQVKPILEKLTELKLYASKFAAVSATGIGEEIVDDGLGVRLESRVRDGLSLEQASAKCFDEATARQRDYGWIALTARGAWNASWTTEAMTFAGASARDGVFVSSLKLDAQPAS